MKKMTRGSEMNKPVEMTVPLTPSLKLKFSVGVLDYVLDLLYHLFLGKTPQLSQYSKIPVINV